MDGSSTAVRESLPNGVEVPQRKRIFAVLAGPSPIASPVAAMGVEPHPNEYSRPKEPATVSKYHPDELPGVDGVMKTVPPFGPVSPMRQRDVVHGPGGATVVVVAPTVVVVFAAVVVVAAVVVGVFGAVVVVFGVVVVGLVVVVDAGPKKAARPSAIFFLSAVMSSDSVPFLVRESEPATSGRSSAQLTRSAAPTAKMTAYLRNFIVPPLDPSATLQVESGSVPSGGAEN